MKKTFCAPQHALYVVGTSSHMSSIQVSAAASALSEPRPVQENDEFEHSTFLLPDISLPSDITGHTHGCFSFSPLAYWLFAFFLVFALSSFMLPWATILSTFLAWVQEIGPWGIVVIMAAFVLVSFPFTFGYTPLALSSGFLFGAFQGLLAVSLGSCLGAATSFWLCRRLINREQFTDNMRSSKIAVVLFAMGESGWKGAIISRFVPFPFGLSNAILSMTSIPFRCYICTTFLGLLPFQIMFTYFGSTLRSLADVLSGKANFGVAQTLVLIFQIALSLASVGYLYYVSRKYQSQHALANATVETV